MGPSRNEVRIDDSTTHHPAGDRRLRGLPRLADVNASTDGAGAGYSDLLASPEVGAGDSLGTRFDDPARAAYDAGLGSAAADDPADGGLSIRTGEVR